MRRFTRLYLELDATTSTADKVRALEAYFRDAPDADAAWAVALLTGQRPKGGASTRALRALAQSETGVPGWLVDECYAAVGDLSETVALLLPEADEPSDEPLHAVMRGRVLPLPNSGDAQRAEIIRDAWRAFDSDQRFVFHKLIRGGFRVGVQRRLVARALAAVADTDPERMAHRLSGTYDPTPESYRALIDGDAALDRSRPYPFFLAHQLDDPPEALGDPDEWIAEWKWDGVRAQLIRRDDTVALWSRGGEPIGRQFPELLAAARALPADAVLDGEVVVMTGDRPRPFARLQRRLNRTSARAAQPGLFESERAVFLAFDLLERDGDDLRALPLAKRRETLEQTVRALGPDAPIRLSEPVEAETWDEYAAFRAESRERGVEGLLLKHKDSVYGVGRTKSADRPGWWKWKIDPLTVDAVLVYAQPGSGRRAGLLTDYTFAVWDDRDGESRLTPFAKAYSGLTQDEIERVDAWIRRHTTGKNGPVRHVEPELVFEIGFEGIRRSDRHKSGVAVRFPRILKQRDDKAIDDADTLATLMAMLPEEERP